jgi:hypothetical protein
MVLLILIDYVPVQVPQKMLPVCFTPKTVLKFIQNLNASGGGVLMAYLLVF